MASSGIGRPKELGARPKRQNNRPSTAGDKRSQLGTTTHLRSSRDSSSGVKANYDEMVEKFRKTNVSYKPKSLESDYKQRLKPFRHQKHQSLSPPKPSGKARYQNISQRHNLDHKSATSSSNGKRVHSKGKLSATKSGLAINHVKKVLNLEPAEVLFDLSTEKHGNLFNELVNEEKLPMDWMSSILEAIALACSCTSAPETLTPFLTSVWHSKFVQAHLQRFVICLPFGSDNDINNDIDLKPVEDLITLLRALLQHFQRSCYAEVGVVLILLENVITSEDKTQYRIPIATVNRLQEVREIYDIIASQRLIENKKKAKTSDQDYENQAPPDDYRYISIIPDIDELRSTESPFMRKNIIKGKYTDTNHYLDVQFRLLREDFVAPLREGISEYLCHQDPSKRLQDMRLYHNVRVIRRTLTHNGLAHLIRFDTKQFRGIQWESSKRLIHGSLVCLTSDNFENVIFATVVKREVRDLKLGFVVVKFTTDAAARFSQDNSFLMAETSAYYEAYQHVLRGLQKQDDIPFQSYIVGASSDESSPSYLRRGIARVRYDLRLLSKTHKISDDGHDSAGLSLDAEHDKILRAVDVSQPGQWFDPDILGFDESQLKAYQAALSKEFVIIQGPPGTGKTFVGLKIVKTLLFNFQSWSQNMLHRRIRIDNTGIQQKLRPMLIVCYTNHALDQFLEEIFSFEENIVRVGGRRSSEVLEPCSLPNIRQRIRKEKKTSAHVHHRRSRVRQEHYQIRKSLEIAEAHLQLAERGILNFYALNSYVHVKHRNSLIRRGLYVWLGLRNNAFQRYTNEITSSVSINSDELDNNDRIHIMGQAEILAEQRVLEDNFYLKDSFDREGEFIDSPLTNIRRDFEFLPLHLSGEEDNTPTKADLQRESSIALAINNPDVMTEAEVSTIEDLWKLPYPQRWRLYRHWMMGYIHKWEQELQRLIPEYEPLFNQLKEIDEEEDYLILNSARVIGMTTTGAAKYRSLLERLQPPIVIVEEAAEVLEAHVITTLSKGCQHLILIGDHQQLRPNPTVYRLAKDFNLDVSLFERMINNGLPCYRLGFQHRMCPDVSTIMKKHFYDGLNDAKSVLQYEDVKGICSNMFYVEHEEPERMIEDSRSKSNIHEAKFLVSLCKYILKQGYTPSQVTILTTYAGQLSNFRKLMDKKTFEGVRVTVVDNFQGEENDIILLSLVRSNDEGSVGFLKVANRVCVALSRAKRGLFCIGNMKLLARKSPLWKDIVVTLREKKQIGPALSLGCQNHPQTVTMVSCENDFKKVPEGGCMRACETRLNCGHSCTLLCHPFDQTHEEFECMKDCCRKCPRDHQCPLKCYQECKCQIRVQKTFEACKHTMKVTCYRFDDSVCLEPCQKELPCGHLCQSKCGMDCPEKCPKPCTNQLSCGHNCRGTCGSECFTECYSQCTNIIACGHACNLTCHFGKGQCGDPHQCKMRVQITLPCKHLVKMACKDNPVNNTAIGYPQCISNCQVVLKCDHKCPNKCAEPCASKCTVRVKKTCSVCKHKTDVPCFEFENAVCQESCEKLLPCGHKCASICGNHVENKSCNAIQRSCSAQCLLDLDCGHRCQNKCGDECTKICNVQVIKPMSDCNHSQETPCGVDPVEVICKASCSKKYPCGHQCKKTCGESCDKVCAAKIKTPRNDCSHLHETICGTKPAVDTKCHKQCKKVLQCHHNCANKCYEQCTKICKVKVEKKHPICGHKHIMECNEDPLTHVCRTVCQKELICGHKIELPCNEDTENIKCRNKCQEKLKCDHMCQKICGSPCTTVCKEEVIKILPKCGHPARLPCHSDPTMASCKQLCGKRLKCGHVCQNKCGDRCHKNGANQQLNEACDEVCNKTLMCGHVCKSRCKDCIGGRFHQPCQTTVSGVSLTCGCQYSGSCCKVALARHKVSHGIQIKPGESMIKETSRFCLFNINLTKSKSNDQISSCRHVRSSGESCNNPCDEILKCGHQCISYCGEPCPNLCRFCDRLEITSIPSKHQKDDDHDALYISLEKCNHVVEVSVINSKVHDTKTGITGECKPILPIICPTCSIPVTHDRFKQHVTIVQRYMRKVLDEIKSTETRTQEDAKHLLKGSGYEYRSFTSNLGFGQNTHRRTITKPVERQASPQLTWLLTVLKQLKSLKLKFQQWRKLGKDVISNVKIELDNQIECLGGIIRCLEEIIDAQIPLTKQMASDIYNEIVRSEICTVLMRKHFINSPLASKNVLTATTRADIHRAILKVTSWTSFSQNKLTEIQTAIEEICGVKIVLEIETFEQVFGKLFRGQLSFEAGMWMVCESEHVFCNVSGVESNVCPKCYL